MMDFENDFDFSFNVWIPGLPQVSLTSLKVKGVNFVDKNQSTLVCYVRLREICLKLQL